MNGRHLLDTKLIVAHQDLNVRLVSGGVHESI
jgi:hypothetical protein